MRAERGGSPQAGQEGDVPRSEPEPSRDPALGSKCIINACKEYRYIKEFPPRGLLQKEVYDSVCSRRKELGSEGEPPKVTDSGPFADRNAG